MNDNKTAVTLNDSKELKQLEIFIGERKFTSYSYDDSFPKPFFTSIYNLGGDSFTRFAPYHEEHKHQRSVFIAIGDVNGIDFWNEEPEHGNQLHKGFDKIEASGNTAKFTSENDWTDKNGEIQITDKRTFTVTAVNPEKTYLDILLTLNAGHEDAYIGKTKEAGPLGIRIADALRADKGGYILNADGKKGEEECWGKRSAYCTYGGKLNGTECRVTLIDSPLNDGFPTYWHVRNYGLMAANNLYFSGGYVIPAYESRFYRYRIVFTEGGEKITEADLLS